MTKKKASFKQQRPLLAIEVVERQQLGNCYESCTYRITSIYRLSKAALQGLADVGFLGSGQEFYIRSQCDGKEVATGEDACPYLFPDGTPAPNWEGKPQKPMMQPYWTYLAERRVDSGD